MSNMKEKFEIYFQKMEKMGVHAANKAHRGFINLMFLFMGWNVWTFVVNYNSYWRLRRDPNIPKEWLQQSAPRKGNEDWLIEKEREEREKRLEDNDRTKNY